MKLTKRYVALPIIVVLTTLSFHASAQTVNTVSGVNFGAYDFATTFNVRIQLGTDGNALLIGSGASFQGGEAAGHIRIITPDTGIIEIKCTNTAQLFDPSATALAIENIEISVNTGVAFGNGNACNGLGGGDATAATIDMDALPDPDVFIGGEITLSSPITLPSDHTYSTTGSGTPIMLSIVIQ